MLEDRQNKFPNRAHSGDAFETKRTDSTGRVGLVSESGEGYLVRGTMLVFKSGIAYVGNGGTITSPFRKATVISDDLIRLPDGKDIPVQDLVPHLGAEVVLSEDIVNEQLKRQGIVEL